jgi:outer membrane protein TolC
LAEAEAQLHLATSNSLDAKLTLDSKLRALRLITGQKDINLDQQICSQT